MNRLLVALLLIPAFTAQPAIADDAEPSGACQAAAVFTGAAMAYTAAAVTIGSGGTAGGAIAAGMVAVGGWAGHENLSEPCQEAWDSFDDYMTTWGKAMAIDDVDEAYEEFVELYCGGTPMNCAPLNVSCAPFQIDCQENPWQRNPWDCHLECMFTLTANTMPNGRSVNDLANALTFISLSSTVGYWDTQNHGYLIGIYPEPSPPPGSDEIY